MSDKQKEAAVVEPPTAEATTAAEKPPEAPKVEPPATPAKFVELRHKETMFYDGVTGFEIIRDERKKLTKPIGKETQTAIETGRLLIVK